MVRYHYFAVLLLEYFMRGLWTICSSFPFFSCETTS